MDYLESVRRRPAEWMPAHPSRVQSQDSLRKVAPSPGREAQEDGKTAGGDLWRTVEGGTFSMNCSLVFLPASPKRSGM
jgi:hypothetical protein